MHGLATETDPTQASLAGSARERVLVLGVGNLLVGDEGVGVHAVRALQGEAWPDHVEIVDGGTGGFHLLEILQSAPRVVLIDATRDGLPPGSVSHFRARRPSDFPTALGAHDIGLKDLLASAALLGALPEIEVITISILELKPMTLELSPAVASALPEVARLARQLAG